MEFPRRLRVSPERAHRRPLWPTTLIVAGALFLVSIALTLTVGGVLSGRLDRLEQRIEALAR